MGISKQQMNILMNRVIKILINCVKIGYYKSWIPLSNLKYDLHQSLRYLTEPRSIPKDFDDEYIVEDYNENVELGWNGKYCETP